MFLFPSYRHERAPWWYKANVVVIIIALLNAMAFPAYAELERKRKVRELAM